MPAIGLKIKKLRELKGLKQDYMADKLGISQQTYSKLENEKTDIPFSRIEQLAEIFEIKPEELVGFDAQYVVQNYGKINRQQFANVYGSFAEELKQLYEDKITLLEENSQILKEKVVWLEEKNAWLQNK